MPEPNEQAALDQVTAAFADTFPPMWRRIYEANFAAGFTETESFKLLQTYILASCVHGIRGDDG